MRRHVLAMRLFVEFVKMRHYCMNRDTCKGCPYFSVVEDRMVCSMISTDEMMDIVARVFSRYLLIKDCRDLLNTSEQNPKVP